jgi:hypothetical protein
VEAALESNYDWDSTPGRWLTYCLVLAMPFPEKAVRPDNTVPWTNPRKSRKSQRRNGSNEHGRESQTSGPSATSTATSGLVTDSTPNAERSKSTTDEESESGNGETNRRAEGAGALPQPTHHQPIHVPTLPETQYSLPALVGAMFDAVILPRDALRRMADAWIDWSFQSLMRLGAMVRPLRAAADAAIQAARTTQEGYDGGTERRTRTPQRTHVHANVSDGRRRTENEPPRSRRGCGTTPTRRKGPGRTNTLR